MAARDGRCPVRRRWGALAVLCVSLLLVTLDRGVLVVALPTLVRQMHVTSSQLQWIVAAYLVVFAGLLLVGGSLADRIGRKRILLAGLAVFAAGSAWAAFSGSVGALIAARASMGIGGALMIPSSLSIITNIFREPWDRQRAIGVWAGTAGVGSCLGPVIGGLLLAHFWWGSVFLIEVPIAAVGLAFVITLVPDSKNPAARPPDAPGALLSVAALGLVLFALIEAPMRGWTSAVVIGTGAGGLAAVGGFVGWERLSPHPMLNLGFFRERRFSGAVTPLVLGAFGLFGSTFLLALFIQFILGHNALEAGVRELPIAGTAAVVAVASPLIVRVAGAKLTLAAGLLILAGGLWLISATSLTTGYGGIVAGQIMIGGGTGLVIPSATASVIGVVPRRHAGVGSATNELVLQTGGALGVAVIGSLFSTRYQGNVIRWLAPHHVPAGVLHTARGSVGGALGVSARIGGPLGHLIAQAARSAFVSGMQLGLLAGGAVAVAGAVVALLVLPPRTRADRLNRLAGETPATKRGGS
jgi:EmrB/QacA subfamily drug resistance transporter